MNRPSPVPSRSYAAPLPIFHGRYAFADLQSSAGIARLGGVSDTPTIEVTVDGFAEQLPPGLTLAELLQRRGDSPKSTIVEHNGAYVRADRLSDVSVAEGDRIEIILPAFGG